MNFARCDICCEFYDEILRIPKFLTCFHTVCSSCIQKLASKSLIVCPHCRKETTLGPNGVRDLRNNFYILNSLPELIRSADQHGAAARGEPPNKKTLEWCSNCNCLVGPECRPGHTTSKLSDLPTGEMYLHSLMFLCKSIWTTISNNQQQAQKYVKSCLHALHQVQQDMLIIQRNNTSKQKETQQYLKDLDKTLKDLEEGDGLKKNMDQVQSLLENFSSSYRKGQEEIQGIMELTNCFSNLETGLAHIELENKYSNKTTMEKIPLGLPAESHWHTLLTLLLLKETNGPRLEELKEAKLGLIQENNLVEKQKQQQQQQQEQQRQEQQQPKRQEENTGARKKEHPLKVQKPQEKKPGNTQGKTNQKPRKDAGATMKQTEGRKANTTTTEVVDFNRIQINAPPQNYLGPTPTKKNIILDISRNGQPFGIITIQLCVDMAPVMCTKFLQFCQLNEPYNYHGSSFFEAKPNEVVHGGRIRGFNRAFTYPADQCPLQRTRGSVSMRLMADVKATNCFIVGSEFAIHLESKPKPSKGSTVFGYVIDGLGLCEIISQLDVAINSFRFDKIHITS